jgi:hypothetical protein
MRFWARGLPLWLGLWALPVLAAEPTCFKHDALAKTSPISAWDDLKTFRASPSLNSAIGEVQVWTSGVGRTNHDYHAFTFRPRRPMTAEAIFAAFRANFEQMVFIDRRGGSFNALNAPNLQKWKSADPTGAVMVFDLPIEPRVTSLISKRVSVVTSCVSQTDMIFTTVQTISTGSHPVSGNRGFAVRDNGNGTFTILTKAVDRVTNLPPYSLMQERVLEGGERTWRAMLFNLGRHFEAAGKVRPVSTSQLF